MTQENVQLVEKFYFLFGKKDKQFLELCDDSIEWVTMKNMPNGGTYIGKKAIFEEYFPKMLANFEEFHASTDEFIEAEDKVLVLGTYHIISKSKKFDAPFAHVYTIKDNKIAKFQQYTDTAEIRNAL